MWTKSPQTISTIEKFVLSVFRGVKRKNNRFWDSLWIVKSAVPRMICENQSNPQTWAFYLLLGLILPSAMSVLPVAAAARAKQQFIYCPLSLLTIYHSRDTSHGARATRRIFLTKFAKLTRYKTAELIDNERHNVCKQR